MSGRLIPGACGKLMGRQPERLYFAPSKSHPWYGTINGEDRFTVEQVRELMSLGRDPLTAEAIKVHRQATSREMWWPTDYAPPVFEFECPVITRRKDSKVKVITPSGETAWVRADGWAGFPDKRNWSAYK